MAAPSHAYPIGQFSTEEEKQANPLPDFVCEGCGYRGNGYELLGVDEEETLWCPQCRTIGWVWQ